MIAAAKTSENEKEIGEGWRKIANSGWQPHNSYDSIHFITVPKWKLSKGLLLLLWLPPYGKNTIFLSSKYIKMKFDPSKYILLCICWKGTEMKFTSQPTSFIYSACSCLSCHHFCKFNPRLLAIWLVHLMHELTANIRE